MAISAKTMNQLKIILASASPTRKKLLEQLHIPFTVEASSYEEDITIDLPPKEIVKTFSQGKARDVAARHKNAIVIGADTISLCDGEVMGKPVDEADATRMLKKLRGRAHTSLVGLTIINTTTGEEVSLVETAEVHFRDISDEEISAYIATGEPFGKAGAYAIQEAGAAFIEKIIGEPYVPAGFPMSKMAQMLYKMGTKPPIKVRLSP